MRLAIPGMIIAALVAAGCAPQQRTVADGDGAERWAEGRLPKYAPRGAAAANAERRAEGPIRIGLMLPLSGAFADYGQNLLDAASLAVFDLAVRRPVEILPRDTGGQPESAGAAAVDALADGATALIGPASPAAVPNVVRTATAKGAPVLMLTGDRRFAEPGVFAAGHAPQAATTRIVDFAHRHGVTHIAALAPQSAFSRDAMAGLQAATQARGMKITQAGYLTERAGPDDIVRILTAALQSLGPDGALFLPFPAEDLAPFAEALDALAPGRAPMLLGVSNWESAGLPRLPAFANAVYAGPDPARSAGFRQRYADAFGRAPARDAALMYDLVATLALAGQGASVGGVGPHDIATPQGFAGVEGPFRFRLEGGVQRGYAIVGVQGGRLAVVEPAPARFDAAF